MAENMVGGGCFSSNSSQEAVALNAIRLGLGIIKYSKRREKKFCRQSHKLIWNKIDTHGLIGPVYWLMWELQRS